jgi:hypothetical protein
MQIFITFSTTTVLFFLPTNFCSFHRAKHKLQDASSVSPNETHTGAQNSFLFFSSFFCPSFLLYFIIPNFSHFCPPPLLFGSHHFSLPLFCPLSLFISYIFYVSLNCSIQVTLQQNITSLTALSFWSGSMLNMDRHFLYSIVSRI